MSFAEFRGGVALVSGASSGIGRAVTLRLLREGATVVVIDRDPHSLAQLEAFVSQDSDAAARLRTRTVDVTNAPLVSAEVELAERALGPISWLVSGAGILRPGALLGTGTSEALRAHYAVHVEGLYCLMDAVAPRMLKRGQGSVVTVSSNAGAIPRVGMGAYAASKAAQTMLMKCYALELAPTIRCNVVSPGSTDTPMLKSLVGEDGYSKLIAGDSVRYKLGIPLARIAEPDDIASAILFLLSPHARHITGHDLRVDGGATP